MSKTEPCYLCGRPGNFPLVLRESFTSHSLARCPESTTLCDRCHWCLNARLFYYNRAKQKWSKLYARGLTVLYLGDRLAFPVLGEPHTEGKDTFPVVSELATRETIRGWLLDPPEPPFTIAIAESGQKYVLPWAQESHSRDHFPVQFELDTINVDRTAFTQAIATFEELLALEFSKDEIVSGDYRSDRMMAAFARWYDLEAAIAPLRGSAVFRLLAHVAQKPATPVETPPPEKKAIAPVPPPAGNSAQLSLL